ncbi:hypothetical protein HRR87_005924 [Exophiala dermatitidis]|nr:hypothetical protein HRR87_005924 [Exophiala dermatitidis]
MARVKQKTGKLAAGGASTQARQAVKQRNKHKVVVENTSQEKNKLRSVVRRTKRCARGTTHRDSQVTFRADPPPGYTFIPAGNPELTAALKEFARRGDHKIFAVTTTPHADRHELSREVHRVGFHFPTSVVAQVCAHYGIRLTSGGKVIDESKDDKLFTQVYQNGRRPVEEEKDQITINTEAKQTIKDLFPNIPDKDLFQIIKTAFQKGDNRVGTADEIPLVRRAQLSVVAHIRHMYTQYDKLLRKVPYNDARHMVEQDTLKKIIEWRGDEDSTDEATQRAADDLLREVIVISDEEAGETESDDGQQVAHDNVQLEELPSATYGPGSGRPRSPLLQSARREDTNQDYHDLPRVVRRYQLTEDEIAQRNRSRYAVWDQARRDYRARAAQQPVTVVERIYEPESSASRILVPLDPPSYPVRSQEPPLPTGRDDYEPRQIRRPSPPTYIRGADGTLYERVTTRSRGVATEPPTRHDDYALTAMPRPLLVAKTRPSSPEGYPYRDHRHLDPQGADATVLPSIEGTDGSYLSPHERQNPFDRLERRPEARETNIPREDSCNRREAALIDLPASPEQSSKRRRLEEIPMSSEYRTSMPGPLDGQRDRLYFTQSRQPGYARAEARVIDYGEPRSSPRYRQPASAREPLGYVEHQSVYDTRNAPPHEQPSLRAFPAVHDRYDTANKQSHYPVQSNGLRRSDEFETNTPRRLDQHFSTSERLVYEPRFDSRGYENQHATERTTTVMAHYADPNPRQTRPRCTYQSMSTVREPVVEVPGQHEYDHRQATTAGQYGQSRR